MNIKITDKAIELIAKNCAPKDTPDEPAYPNHSDTDIWINGFICGFKMINIDPKILAVEFFQHWYNSKGNNTYQGFDEWFPVWLENYNK